jgi:hypothetical protein
MEGNPIVLQHGWHIRREAGSYAAVVDEHGRVVHDAIQYGEAFKKDQRREQLGDDVFAAVAAGNRGGGGSNASAAPVDNAHSAILPSIGSVTTPSVVKPDESHRIIDIKHRLPRPRNQMTAAVFSPWIWTALAILIIVYFIAALA